MPYLSSDLITAVKRRAAVPTSQITFQPADYFQLADEEIRSKLIPLITKNIEDYYTVPFTTPLIANQFNYPIPTRAVAQGLRDIEIIQDGDRLSRTPLERLDRSDLYATYSGNYRFTIRKNGFYLEGNNVVIYPTPLTTQNQLSLCYTCRPNQIVATTECGQVQSINFSTNQITLVSTPPQTFTTSSPLDFINAMPGFSWAAQDMTPTSIVGNVLTFASALPTSLLNGDWICLSGQSCVVQVPVELQPLLYQYVTVRLLSAQGDAQALHDAIAELTKLEENAQLLTSPRVVGKSKRVTNTRAMNRWV
jgi:hypothetical protein